MTIEIRALKEEVDVLKKESKSSESVDSLA